MPLDRVHGELQDAVALIAGPERRARDADDESHDVIDADVVASRRIHSVKAPHGSCVAASSSP
jgi:hypothetical protein